MPNSLPISRFHMWRAVVAMVHADGIVTPHEIDFVNTHILNLPLSEGQMKVIRQDIQTPQDVGSMFSQIEVQNDKRDFFVLARALAWCDGDLDKQEAKILHTIHAKHMATGEESLLRESSEILNEVELCHNQWKFKSERSKSLLGFLSKLKTA